MLADINGFDACSEPEDPETLNYEDQSHEPVLDSRCMN